MFQITPYYHPVSVASIAIWHICPCWFPQQTIPNTQLRTIVHGDIYEYPMIFPKHSAVTYSHHSTQICRDESLVIHSQAPWPWFIFEKWDENGLCRSRFSRCEPDLQGDPQPRLSGASPSSQLDRPPLDKAFPGRLALESDTVERMRRASGDVDQTWSNPCPPYKGAMFCWWIPKMVEKVRWNLDLFFYTKIEIQDQQMCICGYAINQDCRKRVVFPNSKSGFKNKLVYLPVN